MLCKIGTGCTEQRILPGNITAKQGDGNHQEENQPIPDVTDPEVVHREQWVDPLSAREQNSCTGQ